VAAPSWQRTCRCPSASTDCSARSRQQESDRVMTRKTKSRLVVANDSRPRLPSSRTSAAGTPSRSPSTRRFWPRPAASRPTRRWDQGQSIARPARQPSQRLGGSWAIPGCSWRMRDLSASAPAEGDLSCRGGDGGSTCRVISRLRSRETGRCRSSRTAARLDRRRRPFRPRSRWRHVDSSSPGWSAWTTHPAESSRAVRPMSYTTAVDERQHHRKRDPEAHPPIDGLAHAATVVTVGMRGGPASRRRRLR
jgi:hypothetical protein